jgi:hypothetical protein
MSVNHCTDNELSTLQSEVKKQHTKRQKMVDPMSYISLN